MGDKQAMAAEWLQMAPMPSFVVAQEVPPVGRSVGHKVMARSLRCAHVTVVTRHGKDAGRSSGSEPYPSGWQVVLRACGGGVGERG